jgi:Domain of unknown function (DUF4282)
MSQCSVRCLRRGPGDAAAPSNVWDRAARLRENGFNSLAAPLRREEDPMFDFRDLFQWERFITPSIIKIFYWLAVGIAVLFGLSGIISGLALMSLSPLAGLFYIIASLIGMVISVIFARIISEFVLIMFRINEHLGAIRQRGQM